MAALVIPTCQAAFNLTIVDIGMSDLAVDFFGGSAITNGREVINNCIGEDVVELEGHTLAVLGVVHDCGGFRRHVVVVPAHAAAPVAFLGRPDRLLFACCPGTAVVDGGVAVGMRSTDYTD